MEVQEEVMGASGGGLTTTTDQVSVFKGKRTKRQRPMSPFALTMAAAAATSSYSSGDSSGPGGGGGFDRFMTPSPSSDSAPGDQLITTTVDDQEADMANCLILLAQGRSQKSPESVLAAVSKVAAEVYQCKTCNRCFPSFQALGGHRASHKKPNNKAVFPLEEKKQLVQTAAGHHQEIVPFKDDVENTTLSLQIRSRPDIINNVAVATSGSSSPIITNKSRVHECSICGAEFSSGQALGGHMRRHRPITTSSTTTTMVATTTTTTSTSHEGVKKKPRTLLSLDLNLPAPEDVDHHSHNHHHHHHHRDSKFPFAPKEQVIVFSASPLVDCHY